MGFFSVSSIDYDLELEFLKTDEEREAERRAQAAKEAAAAAAVAQSDALAAFGDKPNNNQISSVNNRPMVDR